MTIPKNKDGLILNSKDWSIEFDVSAYDSETFTSAANASAFFSSATFSNSCTFPSSALNSVLSENSQFFKIKKY